MLNKAFFALLAASSGGFLKAVEAAAKATIPTVTNQTITYQGFYNNSVESFLNIRFGKDTSGQARFTRPQPYIYPENAMVNASVIGAACPQSIKPPPASPPGSANVSGISEDCLTLGISRVQNTTTNELLPVMVWFYGGGWTVGDAYSPFFDPTALLVNAAKSKLPVVYVAINYRVSIFGFPESDALAVNDSLNLGLLDQRLGLEWVQENIHLFGGNPDNVTLFGESAGAFSTGIQLLAYGGKKSAPFQRIITESGAPTSVIGLKTNSSAVHTSAVASLVGCASSKSEEQLSCLRSVPLETLNNVTVTYSNKIDPLAEIGVFQPKSHTSFIPDTPGNLLRDGRFFKNIDILTGWNENDGSFFVQPPINTDAEVVASLQKESFADNRMTNESFAEALALYPLSDFSPLPKENISAQYFRAARMARDSQFTCPSIFMIDSMATYSHPKTKTYLYALNSTTSAGTVAQMNESYLGVSHGADLAFVYDDTAAFPNIDPALIELGSQMSGSWACYAHTGTLSMPQSDLTIQDWPEAKADGFKAFGNKTLAIQVLGGPKNGTAVIGEKQDTGILAAEKIRERCAFWNSPIIQKQLGV